MKTNTRSAENRADLHGLVDLRHVAHLAAIFIGIVAVQPLEIWHLLRQVSNFLAARACRRIQLMAGTTQRRLTDVLRLCGAEPSRGTIHDPLVSPGNRERPVLRAIVFAVGGFDNKSAVEAFPRP